MTTLAPNFFRKTWMFNVLAQGWQPVLRVLAPAGRMALTTYVSQTLIGIFLFYGIGLGLGNKLGFAQATAVAVAIFAIQCVVSRIWLQHFRFGPLEWIWRRATYGTPSQAYADPKLRLPSGVRRRVPCSLIRSA